MAGKAEHIQEATHGRNTTKEADSGAIIEKTSTRDGEGIQSRVAKVGAVATAHGARSTTPTRAPSLFGVVVFVLIVVAFEVLCNVASDWHSAGRMPSYLLPWRSAGIGGVGRVVCHANYGT
ncbi:hypothetical protein K458DRAFT_392010 [Lentithecium fluviatile CBS 122367]|uniref:Uncharacterized protein n=1 Tax=Lentithecium fluviatile CBS 122367 TaxID=1168545 RepID=A0A6G1ISZ0_9PLEO|nr:hypothetical protein K458DRAFT_392010 [Lentithecium fluviatile CBS 122367]